MGLRQWQEALEACEQVLSLNPHDADFIRHKVHLRALLGGSEVVTETSSTGAASSTVASVGEQSRRHSSQAEAYIKSGAYADALSCCSNTICLLNSESEVEDITPFQKAGVYVNRARCYEAAKKFDLVLHDAREGKAHSSSWAEARRLEFVALMKLGRWREAQEICADWLLQHPRDAIFCTHQEEIQTNFRRLGQQSMPIPLAAADPPLRGTRTEPARSAKSEVDQLVGNGLQLLSSKKIAAAEKIFSQAILLVGTARTSQSVQCRGHRARCRLQLSAFHDAIADAHEGLATNPDWIEGVRILCRGYAGLEQWEDASEMCQRVLTVAPQDTIFQAMKRTIDARLPVHETDFNSQRQNSEAVEDIEPTVPQPLADVKTHARVDSTAHTMFALQGCVVAQRYLASQTLLSQALVHLHDGDLDNTFRHLSEALQLWVRLELPQALLEDISMVGPHDAIAWGGAALYSYVQAKRRSFDEVASEYEFWRERVDRFPEDTFILASLAEALYRAGDRTGSLKSIEKAVGLELDACKNDELSSSRTTWLYLRARCIPDHAKSSTQWLGSLFETRSSQQHRSREDELLTYIQAASIDDEWMPHACYSLGMIRLRRKDYTSAKQFHHVAQAAELRRNQLGLFTPIDKSEYSDKRMLDDAFSGGCLVLSPMEQRLAVAAPLTGTTLCCGWCKAEQPSVEEFVQHKLSACASQPTCPQSWRKV